MFGLLCHPSDQTRVADRTGLVDRENTGKTAGVSLPIRSTITTDVPNYRQKKSASSGCLPYVSKRATKLDHHVGGKTRVA